MNFFAPGIFLDGSDLASFFFVRKAVLFGAFGTPSRMTRKR